MKIVHLACVAPPETGGIGQSAFELVRRLRERGHEAVLISRALRRPLAEAEAPFVVRLPAWLRWGNASVLRELNQHLALADVVHLHYPFFGTAEKVADWCLWRRKPLILTFHMDATSAWPLQAVFEAYRLMAQPAIVRAARKILVSSLDYADHSSLRSFRQAHPDRVIELPFGVDHVFFSPGPHNRATFGLPEGVSVVGLVGGMDAAHAFKGVPVLLRAMTLLKSDHHALLVGEGERRRVYEAQARELKLQERCHFTGRLDERALREAYRAMDLLSLPSTSAAEAFGLAALEAMATGIPVIASNLPGVRSVVIERTTGLLVPPANPVALAGAIQELTQHESLRRALGRAARERAVRHFDWERYVDRLLSLYREVGADRSK